MSTELRFETQTILLGKRGNQSTLPDLSGKLKANARLQCRLDESEEVYASYGKVNCSFPYQAYNTYDREFCKGEVKTAVLENEYLRAVFLPEFGGRLWEVFDKKKKEPVLYTNDIIRPSNLATRNAWFSGGVEWNIGIIGHSPFTMDQIYTAKLEREDGTPILRMYEYERIRQVVYQMDFWIEPEEAVLNCRMRIENTSDQEIPMYWWSNAAVPEYEHGRIIVPAKKAYSNDESEILKLDIPVVDGVDVTQYEHVPLQRDFFFEIPKETPKFLMNLNQYGYGLLHRSTDRLQSRKLFSWGHGENGNFWQRWLTKEAGPYVEVQGGLGKTQYGCIPMKAHDTWEWLEQYGPVQVDKEAVTVDYETAKQIAVKTVDEMGGASDLQSRLEETSKMALSKGTLVYCGSGFATLKNQCLIKQNKAVLSPHLEFTSCAKEQSCWMQLLEEGTFPIPDVLTAPESYTNDDVLLEKLEHYCKNRTKCGWYACYQLGVIYLYRENLSDAFYWLNQSLALAGNPWAYHAIAICLGMKGERESAIDYLCYGIRMNLKDLSYIRDAFAILLELQGYQELIQEYQMLDEEIAHFARLEFDYAIALTRCGRKQEALAVIDRKEFVLDDLREGEDSLEKLWTELQN